MFNTESLSKIFGEAIYSVQVFSVMYVNFDIFRTDLKKSFSNCTKIESFKVLFLVFLYHVDSNKQGDSCTE